MRIIFYIPILIFLSCMTKPDPVEYMHMLGRSGLVQTVETDSFRYILSLLPARFMALKSENVRSSDFEELRKEYASDVHFKLVIEDKYRDRLKKQSQTLYYLSDFQKEISLDQDSTLSYYHYEAAKLKGREILLFGFPDKKNKDKALIIARHLHDTILKFNFSEVDIIKFENLEIKI